MINKYEIILFQYSSTMDDTRTMSRKLFRKVSRNTARRKNLTRKLHSNHQMFSGISGKRKKKKSREKNSDGLLPQGCVKAFWGCATLPRGRQDICTCCNLLDMGDTSRVRAGHAHLLRQGLGRKKTSQCRVRATYTIKSLLPP